MKSKIILVGAGTHANSCIDVIELEKKFSIYGLIDKIKPGGWIIADNVLWSGKVIEEVNTSDKATLALLEYNRKVQQDPRVENLLLPLRDGLMICRKKE